MSRGNRILLFEVNNRGNKLNLGNFNADVAPGIESRNGLASPGDGWLMNQGYTMVWWGWEMDVHPGWNRILMPEIVAHGPDGSAITGVVRSELITPRSPSVYLHFADKTALILAVLDKLFAQHAAAPDEAERETTEAGGNAWDRLLARSLAYVRFGLERPGHYRVLYEGRAIPSLDDPRLAALGPPMLDRTAELIRDVRRADSDDAARVFQA